MAALLALAITVIVSVVLLLVDDISGGEIARFLFFPLPALGITAALAAMLYVLLLFGALCLVTYRIVGVARTAGGAGLALGVLENFLVFDRTLRRDYGRWPVGLALIIVVLSIASVPAALLGDIPSVPLALYFAAGVALALAYLDREKLRRFTVTRRQQQRPAAEPDLGHSPLDVVTALRGSRNYRGQLRAVRHNSKRSASNFRLTEKDAWVRELRRERILGTVLNAVGINGYAGLYPHQLTALEHLLSEQIATRRNHVVMATGPGSGRRLTAFLSTLDRTLRRGANVLVVAPDETIMERERKRFHDLADVTRWQYAMHEGEVRRDHEGQVPDPPFEILHCSIDTLHSVLLKDHEAWAEFFSGLELVIVHDIDRYAGVFGANATQVFRRLHMVARTHGERLQYFATSQPAQQLDSFARELLSLTEADEAIHVVDTDSGARPEQVYGVWLPPLDKPTTAISGVTLTRQLVRQNAFDAAVDLLAMLSELPDSRVLLYCAALGPAEGPALTQALFRELNRQLPASRLRVATDEVDFGGLQADFDVLVLLDNSSSVREIERLTGPLGARRKGGLTLVLATHSPAALNLIRSFQPDRGGQSTMSPMLPLDGQHPRVVEKHLICALTEMRLTLEDIDRGFGDLGRQLAEQWLHDSSLIFEDPESLPPEIGRSQRYVLPASALSADAHARAPLDTTGTRDDLVEVKTANGQVVLHVDPERDACEVYPSRQILLGPQAFVVADQKPPLAIPPVSGQLGTAVPLFSYQASMTPDRAEHGLPRPTRVSATSTAMFGVARRRVQMIQELRGVRVVNSSRRPEDAAIIEARSARTAQFETDAILFYTPSNATQALSFPVAHVLSHLFRIALRANLPDYISVTHLEVIALHAVAQLPPRPTVLLYDSFDGGMGLAEMLENSMLALLQEAYRILASCPCRLGCPACIEDLACRHSRRDVLCKLEKEDKRKTLRFLGAVLGDTARQITGWNPVELDKLRYDVVDKVDDLIRIRDGVLRMGLFPVLAIDRDTYTPAMVRFMNKTELQENNETVKGYYSNTDSGPEVVVRKAPEEDLVALMAHEFAHDWQRYKGRDGQPMMHSDWTDRKVVPHFYGRLFDEGFAQWMELRVLDGYGFKKNVDEIVFRMFDEYGEGYHVIKQIEDREGVSGVLTRLHAPVSREDVERLFRESGADTRINELHARQEAGEVVEPMSDVIDQSSPIVFPKAPDESTEAESPTAEDEGDEFGQPVPVAPPRAEPRGGRAAPKSGRATPAPDPQAGRGTRPATAKPPRPTVLTRDAQGAPPPRPGAGSALPGDDGERRSEKTEHSQECPATHQQQRVDAGQQEDQSEK